jgi:hypothetical protein
VANVWSKFSDWRGFAAKLLPPSHIYDRVSADIGRGADVAALDVLWLVGYSAIFLIFGVLVLRRRSFAD